MVYWLTNKLIISYIYATTAFLLMTLFMEKARIKKAGFLNRSNLIVLGILTLNLIASGYSAFNCDQGIQKALEDPLIFYYGNNCFHLFVWTALLVFLFQLCFIWKKNRVKVSTTIACVVQLLILTRLETIIGFIASMNRDYLPSSWSYYPNPTDKLTTIAISILYFITCWVAPTFPLQPNAQTKDD